MARRVLLIGEEAAGIQAFKVLSASQHELVGVLASSEDSASATLWSVANKAGAACWDAKLVRDPAFADEVRALDVDVILNVHSLYLIRDEILDAAPLGGFNMHPGPLPEAAGLNVPSWAIFHGETEHAVTIHQMVARIDAGTIAYEERFSISENGDKWSDADVTPCLANSPSLNKTWHRPHSALPGSCRRPGSARGIGPSRHLDCHGHRHHRRRPGSGSRGLRLHTATRLPLSILCPSPPLRIRTLR